MVIFKCNLQTDALKEMPPECLLLTCICLRDSRAESKYDLVYNPESSLADKQNAKYMVRSIWRNTVEISARFTLPGFGYSENEGYHSSG